MFMKKGSVLKYFWEHYALPSPNSILNSYTHSKCSEMFCSKKYPLNSV